MTSSKSAIGTIAIWTKGYSVSQRSLEFQLVVPRSQQDLLDCERRINDTNWGTYTRRLYSAPHARIEREFALILDSSGRAALLSAAPSEDQHGRPSIVILTLSFQLDWDNLPETAQLLSKARTLTRRLSATYARDLSGGKKHVQSQLEAGAFLVDREFSFGDEPTNETTNWQSLVESIHSWQGIRGVATPLYIGLEANVLVGSDEDLRSLALDSSVVDGLYSDVDKAIRPLTPTLSPWFRIQKPVAVAEKPPVPDLERISEKLDTLIEENRRTRSSLQSFVDLLVRAWTGRL